MRAYIIICEATSDLLRLRPDHLGVVTSSPGVLERVDVIGVVAGGLNFQVPGQGGFVSHSLHQLSVVWSEYRREQDGGSIRASLADGLSTP